MKVLLISPNGLQELSGGGLYLRSIAQALCVATSVTDVVIMSKDVGQAGSFSAPDRCTTIYLEKDARRDILARMLLSPTYLATHSRALLKEAKRADLILFHNSRCGSLMRSLRRKLPHKKFGIVSDNVEAALKRGHRGKNMLQRVTNALEAWIIDRAEVMCLDADFMTYITAADRQLFQATYGAVRNSMVLPITVPRGISENASQAWGTASPTTVLFTGHFGFAPNRKALKDFAEVARLVRRSKGADRLRFVAAGAQATIAGSAYPDIEIVDSPSTREMATLFASSTVYLAPVSWGSGMKTKVAEALSYGLPVICMPNAAVGYEEALENDKFGQAIVVANTPQEMASILHELLQDPKLVSLHKAACEAFDALYSLESQTKRMESLLSAP